MKIIFLDIDGVLNDFTAQGKDYFDDTPSDLHLRNLKEIVDETGAEIVLSSTWRLFKGLRKIVEKRLSDYGMKFIDSTIELREGRAAEISEWLTRHPDVTDYVILDDDFISERYRARHVKTSMAYGLLPTHVTKAISILNRGEKVMLIDQIKKDNIQAMKDRDQVKRGVYSVIIGKYNNLAIENTAKGKETTDSDMLAIIQKTLKELDDEKAGHESLGRAEKVAEIEKQKETISVYLPQQLSEWEIKEIIGGLEDKSLPNVMKYFKTNYAGQVDMSLVSKVARG